MLTRIQEQLGLKGFGRVLLDSFEPDEFDRLVEECGLESPENDSAERKALGLANLISSWPQLAAEVSRLLDTANREVRERIEGLADNALLNQFSPQNTDLEVPPGRLVWALLRCGGRPACQDLLRIWVDFLARRAPASPDAAGTSLETHTINEKGVLEAERRAVAEYAGSAESLSSALDDDPGIQPGAEANRDSAALEPKAQDLNSDEANASSGSMIRPVEGGAPAVGLPVRLEEPASESAEPGERRASEGSGTRLPPADPGLGEAEKERWRKSVVEAQEALTCRLEGIENRLESLEALCRTLKGDLETLRSDEQQLLSVRIEQASSLLAAVQEQTQLVQSRLEKIAAVSRPQSEGPGVAGPAEEAPCAPEAQQGGLEPPAAAVPSSALVEAQPADTEDSSAEAPGDVEEEPEEGFPLPGGEERDEERAEIAEPESWEVAGAPLPGGPDLAAAGPPIEPIFQGETIIVVGGHDHLAAQYEALIEGLGGRLERYASVDEFSPRWLEDLIDRAYLVVVLGNVATQRGVMSLMDLANRAGRRFFVHHSAAPASLHQFLMRLVEGETI